MNPMQRLNENEISEIFERIPHVQIQSETVSGPNKIEPVISELKRQVTFDQKHIKADILIESGPSE